MIPLPARFFVTRDLSIDIGPSVNLLVRDKCYRPGLPDIVDSDGNFLRSQSDIDPGGSRFELSAMVGITYRLCNSWAAGLRYTRGLTPAFNAPGGIIPEKNNAFQLGLAYFF